MKKSTVLMFAVVSFGLLTTNAFADVLSGPSCMATAKVIASEYELKYLKLEILNTERLGPVGDCNFIEAGNVFKIDGGSDLDLLKIGDVIKSGVELNSSMGPSGAVLFIQWKPISFVSSEKTLPSSFELQSSGKPEKLNIQQNIIVLIVALVLVGGLAYYFISRQRKI